MFHASTTPTGEATRASRSSRGRVAAGALAAAALLVAPATSPAYPTSTDLVKVPIASGLAAGGGYVAVTFAAGPEVAATDLAQDASNGGGQSPQTLQVGQGGSLAPAVGVGPLPSWAKPHIGTTADGRSVVVYPKCGAKAASCALWQYDLEAQTAAPVPGVDAAGAGEVEGAMDRGAVAFTRFAPKQRSRSTMRTTLHCRAAGSAKPRLVTADGGDQLALRGGRIAQVRDELPSAGICGNPHVLVWTIGGTQTDVASYGCGMEPDSPWTPTFVGGALIWGVDSINGASRILRYDIAKRTITQAPTVGGFDGFVATGPTRGIMLRSGDESVELTGTLRELTAITFKPFPKKR